MFTGPPPTAAGDVCLTNQSRHPVRRPFFNLISPIPNVCAAFFPCHIAFPFNRSISPAIFDPDYFSTTLFPHPFPTDRAPCRSWEAPSALRLATR
jgi:hypothetical protein